MASIYLRGNRMISIISDLEAIAKLEKEYIKKYSEILSAKKIYMVYWAEIKFSRNMLKILQEMKDKDEKKGL